MEPATHLTLAQRKSLSARLIWFDATARAEDKFAAAGQSDIFFGVQGTVFVQAELARGEGEQAPRGKQERLDVSLRALVDKARTAVLPLYGANSKLLGPTVGGLAALAQTIDCDACTTGSKVTICSGLLADDLTVSEKGKCIEPLKQAFTIALDHVTAHYAAHSTLFRPEMASRIVFGTLHDPSPGNRLEANLFAGARVDFDGAVSRVFLQLWIEKFNRLTYMALPYLMFHECACHVFQGMGSSQPRRETGETDAFSEGWMDMVAFELMKRSWEDSADASVPNVYRRRQLETLHAVHRARLAASVHARYGEDIADRFQLYIRRFPGVDDEAAWTILRRLSFDLTILRSPDDLVARFLRELDINLPVPGEIEPVASFGRLAELVRNYMDDRDVNAFVSGVVGLDSFGK